MKRKKNKAKIISILNLILFLTLAFCQITPNKNNLEVGIGVVDISGDSAVILDPIHVKAIVIRQGAEQFALDEYDVTEISNEFTSHARQIASLKTDIQYNNTCVAATHTPMASPRKDLKTAVIQTISEAQSALKPVNLKSSLEQQFNVSFNHRYFMKDGSVVFNPMFLNPDIVRPIFW